MNKRIYGGTIFIGIFSVLISIAITSAIVFHSIVIQGKLTIPEELLNSTILAVVIYGILVLTASVLISVLISQKTEKHLKKQIKKINPDNPDIKKADKEFIPLINKIGNRNEAVSRQISDLKSAHESQDAMRREFTANISHELKTPLTSISGYAELIENGIAKPEDTKKFAGRIHDEAQRLITLVGDILKISKLDENRFDSETEEFDLFDMCEHVVSLLEKAASDRKISIEITGSHLKIHSIPRLAEEILFNLIDNAIKYNRTGGEIKISIIQCFDGVEISISDTGIGISKEDIPHIFERFYRADKSHSKAIGGTGLGLSIVKHSAISLNAHLSVESEPDRGTTVKVLF